MDVNEIKKAVIMNEYKDKIDQLRSIYSKDEVEESATVENDYKLAVDALKAERAAKIAALTA